MKKSLLLPVVVIMAIVAFTVGGQQALAQSPHHLQFKVVSPAQADRVPKGAKEKPVLEQLMAGFGVLPPVDGGGNDEWPCFPNQNANGADCSTIATGGVVVGQPAFTQSLSACDANSASSANCGQIFWFYEDDTGAYDFGPNPFPAGSVVVIYDDTAFGTLGQTGPGNGFCAGSTETCVNPISGKATATVTTTVGTSTIKTEINMFLE